MSMKKLNAVLLATFGMVSVLPIAAHATLITKASATDVAFSATNTVTDTTANGAAKSLQGETKMNTTQLSQFDKNLGVLTNVKVTVSSTYKQTTDVTVAGNATGANQSGYYVATGTGSSSVKLVVPGTSGVSSSFSNVVDTCSGSKSKNKCSNGATTPQGHGITGYFNPTDLNTYVGKGSVAIDQDAVTNSANLTKNDFATTATAESTINWDGTLNAEYSYQQHAIQSFDSTSFLDMLTLDFGDLYVGDTVDAKSYSISNLEGDRVRLKLTNIVSSGNTEAFSNTVGLFDNLLQGHSNDFSASFIGSKAGTYTATYLLTLGDFLPSNFNYASTSLNSDYGLTLTLKANVLDRPAPSTDVPEPASLMLLGLGGLAFGFSRRRKN